MSSSEIDSFLANKSQDIKVMFLGMGQNAAGITEDIASNIFMSKRKQTLKYSIESQKSAHVYSIQTN